MKTFAYLMIGFIGGALAGGVPKWVEIEYQTHSPVLILVLFASLALIAMGIAAVNPSRFALPPALAAPLPDRLSWEQGACLGHAS